MNELALFQGAGGGLLASHLLGLNTVCGVEIDQYARHVLLSRQDDGTVLPFPIWDDVVTFDGRPWRGVVDIITGGFPCFAPGTLVLTRDGHTPIENVCVGDLVLTHRGRWRKVTSVMQRDGAELHRVRGTGILDTVTTSEHPYYVREKGRVWNNDRRAYDRTHSEPKWVESGKLGRNHYSAQVLPDEEPDGHSIEWWWLVGRYLADGWRVDRAGRENGRVVICCHRDEADELESRITAAGFKSSRCDERTVTKFHITKGDFYAELAAFGRLAHGKRIPAAALCLDTKKSGALFHGWLSGDGHRTEASKLWRGNTVSPALALGLSLVAQRATGRVASIHHYSRPLTCVIDGRTVNQRDTFEVQLSDRNRVSFVDGRYGWRILWPTESLRTTGTVYNISVEEDESYTANGAVVHNCQDISAAGKGAGLAGARSGLWSHFARIIGEVQPGLVFIENSPRLRTRGLDRVLRDLAGLGYDAEWTVVAASDVGAHHERKRKWILAHAHGCRGCPGCSSEVSEAKGRPAAD